MTDNILYFLIKDDKINTYLSYENEIEELKTSEEGFFRLKDDLKKFKNIIINKLKEKKIDNFVLMYGIMEGYESTDKFHKIFKCYECNYNTLKKEIANEFKIIGRTKNKIESVKYYEKSAELGNEFAMLKLGKITIEKLMLDLKIIQTEINISENETKTEYIKTIPKNFENSEDIIKYSSNILDFINILDEETLISFSNAGIFKKARMEFQTAVVKTEQKEPLIVSVDEHKVTFKDAKKEGIFCTCPDSRFCKHRIISILFLQKNISSNPIEGKKEVKEEKKVEDIYKDLFEPSLNKL